MAVYSIKFYSAGGQLVLEHVEQFLGDAQALIAAQNEARALEPSAATFEIWCGARQIDPAQQAA